MSSGPARRVSPKDIQVVQNLIERCLQLYMNQREVVETLLAQAKIEPGFTELAVMQSYGFEYLKENGPLLQLELLKTVAGCEEECSSGGKSRSVWAQLSDGDTGGGRRVRQRT